MAFRASDATQPVHTDHPSQNPKALGTSNYCNLTDVAKSVDEDRGDTSTSSDIPVPSVSKFNAAAVSDQNDHNEHPAKKLKMPRASKKIDISGVQRLPLSESFM
ncbi:hypothetical protein PHYPSEUDO_013051 [Phytophthora pseudosyringae]|uniref:Uncharacterized protein n=1 Tax=Phytophthora pseudosyringae TaxID=221518 RepID=A0A8T1V8J4_9STRA|nr:hypothetical protein PHYPSEUDO_013051 [Phytophthora pseudosyringae]